jgi:hypothetical protein
MTKKILKLLPKWIGIIFACVIGLVLVCFGILFFKPDLVLNPKTLNYAPAFAKRFDVDLKWDEIDFKASKPSLSTHRLSWSIKNLQFKTLLAPVFLSASEFSGQLELNWNLRSFPNIVHLGNFGNWRLNADQLSLGPFASSNEPSTFDINAFKLPEIFHQSIIESATLVVDQFVFKTAKDSFGGPLSINIQQDQTSNQGSNFSKILTIAVNESPQKNIPWCWNKEKCIQHISASAGIGVKDGFVRVASIGPIKIKADQLNLSIDMSRNTPSQTPPPQAQTSNNSSLPAFIADATLNEISTDIKKSSINLKMSDGIWRFKGDLAIQAPKSAEAPTRLLGDLQHVISVLIPRMQKAASRR